MGIVEDQIRRIDEITHLQLVVADQELRPTLVPLARLLGRAPPSVQGRLPEVLWAQ